MNDLTSAQAMRHAGYVPEPATVYVNHKTGDVAVAFDNRSDTLFWAERLKREPLNET